ncbi:Dynein heavy chain family protein [Trichomonas vaginalis G3]|uniref:Dynein-1, subspecies f n=1 Tax=Trichomonas vaginalis (strain ATCC PRA-98 / G3) TaxID=412133 RepID=A2DHK8_TRIV3|nr:dynein light chain binding [Trichomonas vaginalis G3]EAY20056.1 Dynein heavy chain family protein [Trichomonas vaginalis G3]KAI5528008.1 dynein light chain binding [Trichomonas vaginalis G3]|eukprot:XP_001581042.1 Dynein heavy chain family protein [Trichomonas vaginalis G3]
MTDRVYRARTRLLDHEKTLSEKKEQGRKSGIEYPEDRVKIPKIGEWALAPISIDETIEKVEQKSPTKNEKSPFVKPKKGIKAPYKVRPPKPVMEEPETTKKTQVHDFKPGETSTDLNEIIKAKQRVQSRPLPPLKTGETPITETFLPLEIFDDTTYEEYSIEELLKHPEAFSKYQDLNGDIKWEKCKCIGYDPKEDVFEIEWDKTKKRKKVTRFNIRFAIESEEKFQIRLNEAQRLCHQHELQFRFDSRVKAMPKDYLPELSPYDINNITEKTKVHPPQEYNNLVNSLCVETADNFKTMNNQLEFLYDLEHNPLIPNRDEFLNLFEKKEENTKYGLVCVPHYNFQEIFERFRSNFLKSNQFILQGLLTISATFQQSLSMNFLTNGWDEVLTLDEFVKRQEAELDSTCKLFKTSIQETLESVISSTMNDNTMPQDHQQEKMIYQKMVTLTQRMLHTVLLDLISNTLKNFASLFNRYQGEGSNLIPPQFHIDLVLSKENKINLSPTIDKFHEKILSLLQLLEKSVHSLPEINLPILDVDMTTVSFADCITSIAASKTDVSNTLKILFEQLTKFIEGYTTIDSVIALDPEQFTQVFDPDGKKSLDAYRDQLTEFNRVLDICQNQMHMEYKLGIFEVNCQKFKDETTKKTRSLITALLTHMKNFAINEIKNLQAEFNKISDNLKETPKTPEELAALREYMEKINSTTKDRQAKMDTAMKRFAFLEDYKFEISNDECQEKYKTLQMPHKLAITFEETDRNITVERGRMIRELKNNQRQLETNTLSVTEMLPAFISKYQDLEMTFEAVDQVNEIQTKLMELKNLQDLYNKHEALFEFEPAPCKTLTKLIEEFMPLYTLWNLANDWQNSNTTWLDTPFTQTKSDAMNGFIVQAMKKISKLKKDLAPQKALVEKVLLPLTEQIEKFKQHIPLISRLRHPGIKTKHWEKISEIVGFRVQPSMEMTLQQFLDLGLEKWNQQISEIAGIAAQEYNIESTLDTMDQELQTKIFNTAVFRDTGTYILVDVDDIISTVDDQLVTTQTLLTSPFIAPCKKRATERLTFLRSCHDTLDAWVECQCGWLYLQPIFTGTSIQQKLHREARDWQNVDKMWNAMLTLTHNHPEFLTVMHRDRILENLQDANKLLDSITQGLNAYLEAKRLGFPRFFFLSNDELISILSHTKDFDQIQKSMNKLFEYVQTITVDSDMQITHMNDDGLESVELVAPVNGDTPEIEDWLNNFEKEMQDTLKENIRNAIPAASKKKREQWLTEYPAQVILTVNQILWTTQVTQALKGRKAGNLKALMTRFIEQLEGLTTLIRQPLSGAVRQCISCLLIFEVHNRDIIQQLIDQDISDPDDFKWIQQLRYYWEEETVWVRSINNSYEYSYEYAGNSARLVITPLTDRCYQTLLAAFKQNMSGAPSGPAGTGKTETVRDCAKALGRPCVVYNCSEEVTPEQMSQFFAGLSSSGSWSCFDEFNRINIEVLSVIAQQVRVIQEAIANQVETFQLDARTLKLNANAAICITMNPGYAGRTELPDNLKALFRPCAMMVPDFVFISEIMLFSGGYNTASQLSVKLVALFDLCRKQLSNAYHYDWGLRAMKAILSTAGKAKRNNLEAQEAKLLFESIRDCTRPRLVNTDIPLFEGIMHDVFPEVVSEKSLDEKMKDYMRQSYIELHTQPIDLYLTKCNEIYETTLVRHGIMFVGGAMGGKSTAWKALQMTLGKLAAEGIGKPAKTFTLNPKAISIPELYGLFDPVTSGWSDGVLSSFIRDCSMSEPKEWNWIIVDGPVDSLWIETMNSLLDDNKVLCLSNNERISLGAHVKMMFEVDDLSQASPATVSRCGMIYFDPVTLPWSALADSWVTEYKEKYGEIIDYCREMMEKYVPKMVQFIECDGKVALGHNSEFYVKNMFNIINCFFDILRKPEEIPAMDGEDPKTVDPCDYSLYFSRYTRNRDNSFPYFELEQAKAAFEKVLIFSMVWSFGAVLVEDSRPLFDNFIKDLMVKNESTAQFPPKGTCFDYYINFDKMEWEIWVEGDLGIEFIPKSEMEASKNHPVESTFIPTQESATMIFLARLLVEHQKHVLFHGPESSKTMVVKNLFENVLPQKYDCRHLPIANCSTASNILKVMRSFMHKHHGVFGPLTNQQLVIFLDNIGAVKPEIYGAQPPLELIRQLCDYGGWYNTSNVEFQNVVDTTLIACMGPAGSGLFNIPERLMRHFNIIHAPKTKEDSMKNILKSLLKLKFTGFTESVTNVFGATVNACIDIHKQCVENLLPIPSKLHYIFSLRNIIRVLKGMLLAKQSDINNSEAWDRLFCNEMMREYNDRFNVHEDRKWFTEVLHNALKKNFGVEFKTICPSGRFMFNEFADRAGRYKEIQASPADVLSVCRDMLEDHNRDASKQLDIVIFDEAIDHLSNLNRILTMPRGYAILVGVKSSGRKSLARLSLHMSSMEAFEIQITRTYGFVEWREDLKTLMKNMGINDTPTGFILTDSQIIGSYQLEDISNLLITGEVPNLFPREEMDQIKGEIMSNEMLTDEDPWQLFMTRVKKHLHIILVFSPYGSTFKESMLAFPALRIETTIDWYMPWSRNALESVALAAFAKSSIGTPDQVKSVVNVCVQIHKSVEEQAEAFLKETKRFTACTPSRYFDLLNTFVTKLAAQQVETKSQVQKYVGGVEKISTTQATIKELSVQLDHDIPVLEDKKKQVEEMMQQLQVRQGEVETTKQAVEKQSELAEIEEQKASEKNAIAQGKLAEAQPILEGAQKAVDSIDKDSLTNIKTLKKISPALRETFDAICIIFQRSPKKVDGPQPGVKIDDYWPETLSLLNDVQFIKKVKQLDVKEIPKSVIDKLKKYVPTDKSIRDAKIAEIVKGYSAVSNLYQWVIATYDYWNVYQTIIPVQNEANAAAAKLSESQRILAESKAHLQRVMDELQGLQKTLEEQQAIQNTLQENVNHKQLRLLRAQKIMSGLSGETKRWEETAQSLKSGAEFLLGDTLLAAASLTHLGSYSPSFRSRLVEQWKGFLSNENIKFTANFSVERSLGNEPTIRDWVVKGLPNDTHSIENAIIINNSKNSFPLLIDPQLSGTKWLRAVLGETLVVLRFDQSDFLQILRNCVAFGIPVLIENVGLKLDPLIEPILSKEIITVDGQKKISLGGEYGAYEEKFRLFLSTKYPNPHYSPEVCSQVTLINFTTTQDGLSDLLMNNLIEVERDDLDKKRIQIMEANAQNMMKLKEVEAEILQIVSNVGGDILEDDKAIETLQRAQKTSQNIEQQIAASEKTEKQIAQFREKFSPVAARAALLYFCASDFSVVDPMYQFSLKWFVNLFKNAIVNAEHPTDPTALISSFHISIARAFYQSVSFSLFSIHKMLFSTLMAVRILMSEGKINSSELAFLLSPTGTKDPNPTDWLPEDIWHLLGVLPSLNPLFQQLVDSLKDKADEWQAYLKSSTPENENFPLKKKLSNFQQLLILRVFHLHRVREGLRIFVTNSLGKEFIEPPPLNLGKVFKESSPLSPLIFIITPGIDPQDEIIQVAQSMELDRYLKSYSLGRGRGAGAERLIEDASEKGFWVLLQNCHLSLSWMPKLEHIIDNFDPTKVNPRFRLCLVTMSSPDFPIGILYQGSKLIYEIPKGIRENMLRVYSGMNSDEYMSDYSATERKLTFHLAFFHAVVLERLLFGSIGWNIPYEFNPSDLTISRRHLRMFLGEAQPGVVPYESLGYVIGELNYGGRVTDKWDRRLLLTLLRRYFSPEIEKPDFSFGQRYTTPEYNVSLNAVEETLQTWPIVTEGIDVGLSLNASTITARNEALSIFNSLIEIQPTLVAASGSISEDQFALNLVEKLISEIPKPFNVFNFTKNFDLSDTINTVLHHEILLYNKLLKAIKSSLTKLQRGLKGLIVIDQELELLNRRVLANKIPEAWLVHSFQSILTLNSYMEDLKFRVSFLDNWVRTGRPTVFKIGTFFHPEEFLTAVLQVYARKHVVPFDSLTWATTITDQTDESKFPTQPEEGIYIQGLFLEGAKWDIGNGRLVECEQKELISTLPIVYLMPTQNKNLYDMSQTFECTMYRMQNRGSGALGLPNYIMSLFIPTPDVSPDHWIERSVATFITVQQ